MDADDSTPAAVGARIKAIRRMHGLSQAKLARVVGTTPAAIGNWEQGRARPAIEQVRPLCDHFDVTLDYVFLGRSHTLKHATAQALAASLSVSNSSSDTPET